MSKIGIDIRPDLKIRIDIQQMVTVFGDDNGTGKTFMVTWFKNAWRNGLNDRLIGIRQDEIRVAENEAELLMILDEKIKNHVIFIDRVDRLSMKARSKLEKAINKCNNTWILMQRHAKLKISPDVGMSFDSHKRLETAVIDGVTILHDVRV